MLHFQTRFLKPIWEMFQIETKLTDFSIVIACRIDYNLDNKDKQDCGKRQTSDLMRSTHSPVSKRNFGS